MGEAAEDGWIRLVQPGQPSVEHLAGEGRGVGDGRAEVGAVGFLLDVGRPAALPTPPPGAAVGERHVVERAPAPPDPCTLPRLGGRAGAAAAPGRSCGPGGPSRCCGAAPSASMLLGSVHNRTWEDCWLTPENA